MKSKNTYLKEYVKVINEKYRLNINEDNYLDVVVKELSYSDYLKGNFEKYINENREGLDFEWACAMLLFLKSVKEKNVTSVEEYWNKLKAYPTYYYVEYILGDIDLMYYGNLFSGKDRFLKSIEVNTTDANSYYSLGFTYNLLGLFDKSLECYNKAMYYFENSINPREIKIKALYNISAHYITVEKDIDKAEEILNCLLEEDPENVKALDTLRILKGDN